jgi:hypothetical protein
MASLAVLLLAAACVLVALECHEAGAFLMVSALAVVNSADCRARLWDCAKGSQLHLRSRCPCQSRAKR